MTTLVTACCVVGLITFTVGFVLGAIAARHNTSYTIEETDDYPQRFTPPSRSRTVAPEPATPAQPSVYEMSNHVARMFETKARQ